MLPGLVRLCEQASGERGEWVGLVKHGVHGLFSLWSVTGRSGRHVPPFVGSVGSVLRQVGELVMLVPSEGVGSWVPCA